MADEHPSSVSGVFGRPFAEQVAFFRRKLGKLVPTARWDDMQREAHDDGFMVAGAAQADLLTDLAAAVDKAIAEGRGIEEFRRDFRDIVRRNGWTGWTGEGSVKGEAWRVKTILRTNAYTSYSAGREAQLVDGKFPLWVYRHGASEHPRPFHLLLNGLVLPPSHPLWQKYSPPSAWGCSCYKLGARSAAGARRLGGDPDKKPPAGWDTIDRKTGTPPGIDKGWDYAPGASVSDKVIPLAAKVRNWDYRVGKAFMDELPAERRDALARAYRNLPSTAADAERYAEAAWDGADQVPGRTLGTLSQAQAAAVGKAPGMTDADGFDFSLSPAELAHVRNEHGSDAVERRQGQRGIEPADFARLPALLNAGMPRYIGLSDGHKQPVFEISAMVGGEQLVTRWEYWRRRRTMTLLSFFIRTGERT